MLLYFLLRLYENTMIRFGNHSEIQKAVEVKRKATSFKFMKASI